VLVTVFVSLVGGFEGSLPEPSIYFVLNLRKVFLSTPDLRFNAAHPLPQSPQSMLFGKFSSALDYSLQLIEQI
jgi:hypothetical protein